MEVAKSLPEATKNHREEGSKIRSLLQLKDILFQSDNPLLVTEFFHQWPDLQSSPSSTHFCHDLPEIFRKIGIKTPENLRGAVSALTALLNDGKPLLFPTNLNGEIVTGQNDGEVFMENFKGTSDGVKFVAVKFLEKIILLLADGHAEEAAKTLGFILELLPAKFTVMKTSIRVVIINSLVQIAKRRPEFCGRVLQVLVDLNPDVKSARRGHMRSLVYAFKAAFLALLRCPHWGALPWREHLLAVLRGMNFGEAAEQAVRTADRAFREKKRQKKVTSEMTWKETAKNGEEKLADVVEEGLAPALQKLTVVEQEERVKGLSAYVDKAGPGPVHVEEQSDPVPQIIAMIGALLEQGEKGCESMEIAIRKMEPDLLADVVIANMYNLPSRPAVMSLPDILQNYNFIK